MGATLRSGFAVFLGAVVAGLLVLAVEMVGHLVFPPPAGVALNDPEALRTIMATLPLGALVFVLGGWAIGTFAGSWLAATVAPWLPLVHGLIVGVLFLATAVATMLLIHETIWLQPGEPVADRMMVRATLRILRHPPAPGFPGFTEYRLLGAQRVW